MILTYRQCLEKYGTDYRIKKAIEAGILFQKEKGLYSDKKICSELELMTAKYPRAIFAGSSAYYYYGLTDIIPDYYCLTTKREDSRIKDKRVKQSFVNDDLYDIGNAL